MKPNLSQRSNRAADVRSSKGSRFLASDFVRGRRSALPRRYLKVLGALALIAALGCRDQSATSVKVTNDYSQPVYANLVLGQPPTTLPPHCTNFGRWVRNIDDPLMVFESSVPGKQVSFTLPTAANDKGWYKMDAGETITYVPQSIPDSAGYSPAVSFNFFFTTFEYDFVANNGCSNGTFPNATNLAEASINFAINGAEGSGCANEDDTDISAVNGVNAFIQISTQDSTGTAQKGWPNSTSLAANDTLGANANRPGVFGWAATNCSGSTANAGYPNPKLDCAAPKRAPRAPASGKCTTPDGTTYEPIVGPDGTKYCDERSDKATCNNHRQGKITGGTVNITFKSPTEVALD